MEEEEDAALFIVSMPDKSHLKLANCPENYVRIIGLVLLVLLGGCGYSRVRRGKREGVAGINIIMLAWY